MQTNTRLDLDYVLKIASEFSNHKAISKKDTNILTRHTKRTNNSLRSGVKQIKDIYLMKVGKNNYKIGVSFDPRKRLKGVQTGNPYKVELIHSVSSYRPSKIEMILHLIFSSSRLEGEWFKFNRFDIPYIVGVMNKLAVNTVKN